MAPNIEVELAPVTRGDSDNELTYVNLRARKMLTFTPLSSLDAPGFVSGVYSVEVGCHKHSARRTIKIS